MFAVKILTIIVVLQVINNSYCFPHGVLGGLGTLVGRANGLMSLLVNHPRTTNDEPSRSHTDATQPIDSLNFDEMKRDNSERPRTNCSISCARKTFRELVFINKLFRSMENMYGNINDRLIEITADSRRTKRSVPQPEKGKSYSTRRHTSKKSARKPIIGRTNN